MLGTLVWPRRPRQLADRDPDPPKRRIDLCGLRPTDDGMKLLLTTLKDNIAAEKPVRTNELFFTAFYSHHVWRKVNESMRQYIIRREQDFNCLTEASGETHVSENLRRMMLLIFSGLDQREQFGVLPSVGNEYDLKKVSHALRIQYPSASGKPVPRRDYLGVARTSRQSWTSPDPRSKWKGHRARQILTSEVVEDYEDADEEAYYEDEEPPEGDDMASDV